MSDQKLPETIDFTEFPSVSEEEWLKKIALDLRGKNWQDYSWEIEPGLSIDPAQFTPEANYQPLFAKKETFWIGQSLEVDQDLAAANKALMQLLMLGVSAPQLNFSQALSSEDWQELLNQVEFQYLNLHLNFKDLETAKSSLQALPTEFSSIKGKVTIIEEGQAIAAYRALQKSLNGLRFMTISSNEQGFINQLTAILKEVHQLIVNNSEIAPAIILSQLTIELNLSTKLIAEIAKLRAMRLLMNLFFEQFQLAATSIHYGARVHPAALIGEAELDVIRLTSIALSANLGGANAMIFPTLSEEKIGFFQRISTNIQHLFELESHLGKVGDPLAGSHFVEALTEQMASAAWKKFQKLL